MVCCLTLERPGWWSRAARWLEAAREELVWRLEPEPAVVIPMSADRAREELNRRAEELLDRHGNAILRYAYSYLHNMSDAEEVLQDTMIQFLKAAPSSTAPATRRSARRICPPRRIAAALRRPGGGGGPWRPVWPWLSRGAWPCPICCPKTGRRTRR